MSALDMSHTQLRHVGKMGLALVNHMPPGAGAHVAILRGIRQITNTRTIQHSQKYSFHFGFLLFGYYTLFAQY